MHHCGYHYWFNPQPVKGIQDGLLGQEAEEQGRRSGAPGDAGMFKHLVGSTLREGFPGLKQRLAGHGPTPGGGGGGGWDGPRWLGDSWQCGSLH